MHVSELGATLALADHFQNLIKIFSGPDT